MSSFQALQDKRRARQQASSRLIPTEPSTEENSVGDAPSQARQIAAPSKLETTTPYAYLQGVYKELPDSLEIRVSAKRGRGIWVRDGQKIKAGTALFSVAPHAAALSTPELALHCSGCYLSPSSSLSPSSQVKELNRCTGCRKVWYCSRECQSQDWPAHKEECRALKRSDGDIIPGEAVRALARLLWGSAKQGKDSAWWKEVEAMQSNIDRLPPAHHEPLSMLGMALCQYLDINPQTSSREEIIARLSALGFNSVRDLTGFLGRFGTNSFSLTTPDLSNVGVCISPLAALISHSCEPNAVVVFPWGGGRRGSLEVVALRDLEGCEEVLTSYIDVALAKYKRQADLKERYLFDCDCALCSRDEDTSYVDPRESLRCNTKGCKGKIRMPEAPGVHNLACSVCNNSLRVNMTDVRHYIQLGDQALEKAETLQNTEPSKSLHLVTQALPYLSARLSLSSYPLLSLLHLCQQLLISQFSAREASDSERDALVNDACRCGALVLTAMTDVHPPGHPVRGIEYASLAKLLLVEADYGRGVDVGSSVLPQDLWISLPVGLDRLNMAMDLFSKGSVELARGFGKDGGLIGRDVRLLMEGLEREIKMWGAVGRSKSRV